MGQKQAVIFELDKVLYGIDIIEVQEIIRMVEITPVAESEFSTEGIVNLRGQVIPVMNLCRRLNLTTKDPDKDSRIIVTEHNGIKTGLVVDRVLEVGTYDEACTAPPGEIGFESRYLREIVKKQNNLWLILSLQELHQ
ncbi:MAG: hypothetical protein JL50_10465 [Peptococcaceae bacterium BICA1-7]|nr:MAG: hypothetical protein JL50_10465 [Peptococcaceae bacterium BICA1-7]HBV95706.1 chemotaxis protein CheW [Desulfotomaculum sp.]